MAAPAVGTGAALALPWGGGSLLQSDDNDEDFEEEEDFNRESQRHEFPRIVWQGHGHHQPDLIFDLPESQR